MQRKLYIDNNNRRRFAGIRRGTVFLSNHRPSSSRMGSAGVVGGRPFTLFEVRAFFPDSCWLYLLLFRIINLVLFLLCAMICDAQYNRRTGIAIILQGYYEYSLSISVVVDSQRHLSQTTYEQGQTEAASNLFSHRTNQLPYLQFRCNLDLCYLILHQADCFVP